MRTEVLKVPFALAPDDAPCRPGEASRGVVYRCPDCRARVNLHAGEVVQAHFAHAVVPERCDFLNETEAHLRAKQRVAEAVNGGAAIRLLRHCIVCADVLAQPIPNDVTQASLEYVLPNGLRADVALLDRSGALRAAIEIVHTHPCDAEKIEALGALPWAEFDATELLVCGLRWRPINDHFRPLRCGRCRHATVRPFVGPRSLEVQCPLPQAGTVVAVERWAPCPYLLGVTDSKVNCGGRA